MQINENAVFDNTPAGLKNLLSFGATFCPAPFIEEYVGATRARLCCIDKPTDASIATIRQNMLDNKKSASCVTCYNEEAQKVVSFRQEKLATVLKTGQAEYLTQSVGNFVETGQPLPPTRYEISASNLCNFACVMCSSFNSSKIPTAAGELVRYERSLDQISPPENSFVAISGGEPFLNKKYVKFLQRIPVSCEVCITTNASVWNPGMVSVLERFSKLYLHISIDGIGEVHEKIRALSRWHIVEQNAKRLIAHFGPDRVVINTVAQKDNVNHLIDIAEWVDQQGVAWQLEEVRSKGDLLPELAKPYVVPERIFQLRAVKTNVVTAKYLRYLQSC